MQNLRPIDPSECWIRHVRRGQPDDPTAQTIGRGTFVRADVVDGADGINGREGWQSNDVTVALSDDGSFSARFPNAAGPDGRLHRRRFAILTADDYEPGEEWLEFWRDPNDLIAVGTPTSYKKSRSEVSISGVDIPATLEGFRAGELDAWDAHSPVDVARHYLRAQVLAHAVGDPVALTADGAWSTSANALTDVAGDTWAAEARLRFAGTAADDSRVRLSIAGLDLDLTIKTGVVSLAGAPEAAVAGKRAGFTTTQITLRLIAFYDHVAALVNGELVAEFRRLTQPAPASISVGVYNGNATVDATEVVTLAGYAARTDAATADRRVPGIPPATGLRTRYWNAAGFFTRLATRDGRLSRLWPISGADVDPVAERLDAKIDNAAGTVAPTAGAYATRWEGAIYLDLAASDRVLRLAGPGYARVYIAKTRRDLDEAASSWTAAAGDTLNVASLRAATGQSDAGWYPIVIEAAHATSAATWVLSDGVDVAGLAAVPTDRLSPIGTYGELVRGDTHRDTFTSVLGAFGYQWRVEPQPLESGGFPGQIAIGPRIGTDIDVEITDEDVGVDVAVEGKADDVIDGMLGDAAGIADPKGSGELTARVIDYVRALGHATLRIGYESLADITEEPLLRTRLGSLMVLKSSPNEVVGVRPAGQRDLVDTFPLTGALTKNRWRPGDGVRLRLDTVDVIDLSPRQLTRIAWTMRQDGIGHPVVGFRQRPRTVRDAMRRLLRLAVGGRRTYQGSFAIVTGTPGATSTAQAPDGSTRAPMPTDPGTVSRATLVVRSITTTTGPWTIEVNGTATSIPIADIGRYDITPFIGAVGQQMTARLIDGTGSYEITLELLIRV